MKVNCLNNAQSSGSDLLRILTNQKQTKYARKKEKIMALNKKKTI